MSFCKSLQLSHSRPLSISLSPSLSLSRPQSPKPVPHLVRVRKNEHASIFGQSQTLTIWSKANERACELHRRKRLDVVALYKRLWHLRTYLTFDTLFWLNCNGISTGDALTTLSCLNVILCNSIISKYIESITSYHYIELGSCLTESDTDILVKNTRAGMWAASPQLASEDKCRTSIC